MENRWEERGTQSGDGGTVATAQQRAGEVAGAAGEGAKRVAGEAVDEARHVADEAATQARQLFETSMQELRSQADEKARRAAGGLRSWSDQLGALAAGQPDQASQAREYAREAEYHLSSWATRIEQSGIDGLLADVSSFARRRPMVFLGAAGLTGFLLGRIVRVAASTDGPISGDGDGWDRTRELAATEPRSLNAPAAASAQTSGYTSDYTSGQTSREGVTGSTRSPRTGSQ
jgi:hypothetical protein